MLGRKKIKTDLCVVGGGMSGICTAIAAAREGIKVVLMHERPVLGGNASSEIRMWVCGAAGRNNRETGIVEEIMLENYYRNPTKNFYIWDTVLYDFVLREENITLLLNCTCMDAKVRKGNFADGREIKIDMVTGYQMTTQTFFDVEAKFYADCSGDSILAPLTGAQFRLGREGADEFSEDTVVQHADDMTMGLSCLLQGRQTERKVDFVPPEWSTKLTKENFENRALNIYKTMENFWYLELGGNRDTIGETEDIAKELIPLAVGTWDYVKNSGDCDAENWELEFLGFLPGKRESRRMVGEYILTQRDISDGKDFEDTVAYGGWPLDDHYPMGFYHKGTPNTDIYTNPPYPIPYRALYSKNVENLFFAGRNISTSHMALSSVRVMATCGLLGQAAGTAAAVAVNNGLTPHGVYVQKLEELQQKLMENDSFLPGKKREVSPICKNIADNSGLCNGEDRANRLYGNDICGTEVDNGRQLVYNQKGEYVRAVHVVFDSDLNRETLPGDECERYHSMRCNVLLDSPVMCMPKTLCRDFVLTVCTDSGEKTVADIKDNRKRAYHWEINEKVSKITLDISSNWGGTEKTRVISFDFK